ncbi:hypothetical protein CAter282_2376 [Collimonas arenae]|uniref:Uncharacterized protein n=1 Tax=Collimonas arenae TaxID=279058 RepID=A0A127QKJ1_9BURK|nr:hypothetical protein [Collimonas arenae]AMP00245.1 hypothetical protein CAter10_2617 [Collimonas arenae]AMP10122.1 hypothetical protein CAter282_2376 [Collimonas arenae]
MNSAITVQLDTSPAQPEPDAIPADEESTESALDEALEESFPASDPIAITIEKSPCPPI